MHDDGQHQTLRGLRVPARAPAPPRTAHALPEAVLVDEGRVALRLAAAVVRLGRSLTADLRFEDPTVSRRHAVITRDGDGFAVLDDRSLNGVWLNGRRVSRARLRDGDVLEIGRHRLTFAAGATAARHGTADAA
jgi:pSer/pThr/pTyr-binding forkhead associated (FHA) protein